MISGYNGNGKTLTNESYRKVLQLYLTDKHFKEINENVYNDEYNMGVFMGISAKGQIGHTGGDSGVATQCFSTLKLKLENFGREYPPEKKRHKGIYRHLVKIRSIRN